MSKAPGIYAALAALLVAVDARNVHQPEATSSIDYSLHGTTPKPTLAPGFHQLFRRADSSSIQTAYLAPDNTCGFISGLPGAGYTCGIGATCAFYTSSTAAGHVACCNTAACAARLTCMDYNQYFAQSECDAGCAEDTFTLKCTQTAAPYCNTLSFPGDIIDYWCNNINISTVQAASTTYTGQSSRVWTPIPLTGTGAATTTFAPETSSADSSSSANPTETGNGNNGSNNNDSDSGSKTAVGAIVGGVVGGVGALGLIGLAAFFFLRKKKQQQQPQQPQQGPPAYQSPPMQQPGFYDPKFAAAATQQPYPPPNQQYAQPAGFYAPPNPSISPDQSHMDPRLSQAPTSISPTLSGGYAAPGATAFQPQQGVVYEAPAQPADHHRGQMHELA